jgi:hypothetical protein
MSFPKDLNWHSREWKSIQEWASSKLREKRELLEAPGTDQPLTESARGAIEVLKEIMSLKDGGIPADKKQGRTGYDLGV